MMSFDGNWPNFDPVSGFNLALRAILVLVALGTALIFLDKGRAQERAAERRAIEARETNLAAGAAMPASPMACLDAAAGEVVERSCEKAVFASPESAAAAVEYVSARIALLSDESRYAMRNTDDFRVSQSAMRRAAESDRFGVYAHVMAVRYGCDDRSCDVFPLLNDRERVKANLREHRFDSLVEKYAATWSTSAAPQVAGTSQGPAPPPAKPGIPRRIDYPSAASIPAVSIMDPEPARPAGTPPMVPPAVAPSTQQNRSAAPPTARRQAPSPAN